MKIIEKNILTIEQGIIFSQVNCQGIQSGGLAKAIRDKWPFVYSEYIRYSNIWPNDFQRLGKYQMIQVEDKLFVCNCFSQLHYGYNRIRYTDYSALREIFEKIVVANKANHIYFPFNFGCDRGGGDWNIVSKMIDFYFPNAIICKLPQEKPPICPSCHSNRDMIKHDDGEWICHGTHRI